MLAPRYSPKAGLGKGRVRAGAPVVFAHWGPDRGFAFSSSNPHFMSFPGLQVVFLSTKLGLGWGWGGRYAPKHGKGYTPKAGFGKGRVRRLGHLLFSPTGDLTGDLFFFLKP